MNHLLQVVKKETNKQVKEMSKVVQDLKMEIETKKERHTEGILEMANLGKYQQQNISDERERLRHRRYDRRNRYIGQRKCYI